jgi:2TM domain
MTTDMTTRPDLRDAAVKQLKKKRGLQAHLLAYVMVNLLLNALWFLTMPGGFYWPIFPMLGWGIGLAFNVWDVYAPAPTESDIQREMRRLNRS